jgi:hypothetical protein
MSLEAISQETKALTREEENAIAGGFDPEEDRLITQENQLAQTGEVPVPLPPSEKASVRTVSVLLITGIALAFGALIWLFFFSGGSTKQTAAKPSPTPTPSGTSSETSDDLKAKLAFAKQQQDLEKEHLDKVASQKNVKPLATTSKTPVSTQNSKTPTTSAASTPSYSYSQTIPTRTYEPPPRPAPSSSSPSTPASQQDPFSKWERLAKAGKANLLAASKPSTPETIETKPGTTQSSENEPSAIPVVAINLGSPQGSVPGSSDRGGSTPTPGEQGILNQSQVELPPTEQEILVGTTAGGVVRGAIIWASGGEAISNGAIELTEDLKDKEGRVAIPQGSVFIAHAQTVARNQNSEGESERSAPTALLKVMVIGVIVKRNGTFTQIPLSSQAMSVQAQNGGLIEAALTGTRPPRLISGNDFLLGLVGGISKAASLVNAPQVTSSSSINGGQISQSTTSTTPPPNIVGGVIEGAFSPISELIKGRIARRDAYEDKQRNAAPTYYVVSTGTRVQIVVQSFLTIN